MASFNKVVLLGRVTRDPQLKHLPNGSAVCEIGLACNRSWFDKATNQKKEACDFIDITFFGRTAEIAGEYLTKGRPVLIEGRLQYNTWEDKQTNKKMSRIRVIGETMQLLGGVKRDNEPAAPSSDAGFDTDDGSTSF